MSNKHTGATLAIKVDVDTARGTKIGVENLLNLFQNIGYNATFLFSLGPDNTGRAIKRIFKPGFFKKVSRTSVISTYGLKTLMNGVLFPGPHIGKQHSDVMLRTHKMGHEVGIHTYDHVFWQDNIHDLPEHRVRNEVTKSCEWFYKIFKFHSQTMGAAGWQANENSLKAYDDAGFLYASDTRGYVPFFPKIKSKTFRTLQIPTTLPTLDELIGREEYPFDTLHDYYIDAIKKNKGINVMTIHAELEGMKFLEWFKAFLLKLSEEQINLIPMKHIANACLEDKKSIPVCKLLQKEIDGRSGTLAFQGEVSVLMKSNLKNKE